jgi:hypothetical protein
VYTKGELAGDQRGLALLLDPLPPPLLPDEEYDGDEYEP